MGSSACSSFGSFQVKSLTILKGNVGATEGGLPFLEEEEIIPTILEIAEHSLIPSVRG